MTMLDRHMTTTVHRISVPRPTRSMTLIVVPIQPGVLTVHLTVRLMVDLRDIREEKRVLSTHRPRRLRQPQQAVGTNASEVRPVRKSGDERCLERAT